MLDFMTYGEYVASLGLPVNIKELAVAKKVHIGHRAQITTGLLSEIIKINPKDPKYNEKRNALAAKLIGAPNSDAPMEYRRSGARFNALDKRNMSPEQFVKAVTDHIKVADDEIESGWPVEKDKKLAIAKKMGLDPKTGFKVQGEATQATLGENNKLTVAKKMSIGLKGQAKTQEQNFATAL